VKGRPISKPVLHCVNTGNVTNIGSVFFFH
jgi:hypothetical protein